MKTFIYFKIAILFLVFSIQAQDSIPKAQVFRSVQTLKIGSQNLKFNTLAGTMELRDEKNKPIALHGFTAYFKQGEQKIDLLFFHLMEGQAPLHIGCIWV